MSWNKKQANPNPPNLPFLFLPGTEAGNGFMAGQLMGGVCGSFPGHDHGKSQSCYQERKR